MFFKATLPSSFTKLSIKLSAFDVIVPGFQKLFLVLVAIIADAYERWTFAQQSSARGRDAFATAHVCPDLNETWEHLTMSMEVPAQNHEPQMTIPPKTMRMRPRPSNAITVATKVDGR
jgi:hypothetical protein